MARVKLFQLPDNDDEHRRSLYVECHDGTFQCEENICIPTELKCNYEEDCPNGSDEKNCKLCESFEFVCETDYYTTDYCIPKHLLCDGDIDCPYGDDEANCTECKLGSFLCNDGICINSTKKCNDIKDCLTGEDESGCHRPTMKTTPKTTPKPTPTTPQSTPKTTPKPNKCEPDEFDCGKLNCIHISLMCDGKNDCPDGKDEKEDCTLCETNEFECIDGLCISLAKICNGFKDCDNGEDEANCTKPTTPKPPPTTSKLTTSKPKPTVPATTPKPPPTTSKSTTSKTKPTVPATTPKPTQCDSDEFDCGNLNCIHSSLMCDGKNDCPDGKDENEKDCTLCGTNEFECIEGLCIPLAKRCDGFKDCDSGDDEADCTKPTTPKPYRRPKPPSIMRNSSKWKFPLPKSMIIRKSVCTDDQFECEKNLCIAKHLKCDDKEDCPNGNDEFNCFWGEN